MLMTIFFWCVCISHPKHQNTSSNLIRSTEIGQVFYYPACGHEDLVVQQLREQAGAFLK